MKEHVTVIPADKIIIVDGVGLQVEFSAPENLHALQWHMNSGHMEWTDKPNTLLGIEDYEETVQPYVNYWKEEKEKIDREEALALEEYNKPENVLQRKLTEVNNETSAAILAGFDYEMDLGQGSPEILHFSYDDRDQQNFADTANAAVLSLLGNSSVPETITWNAYRNYTPETGGELVRIALTPETFLQLYTKGALVHKAKQMEIGGQRKTELVSQ